MHPTHFLYSTESDGSGNSSLPWCQDTVNRMLVAMETVRNGYKSMKNTESAELSELKELCDRFQKEKLQVVSELENLKNCNSDLNSSIQVDCLVLIMNFYESIKLCSLCT